MGVLWGFWGHKRIGNLVSVLSPVTVALARIKRGVALTRIKRGVGGMLSQLACNEELKQAKKHQRYRQVQHD